MTATPAWARVRNGLICGLLVTAILTLISIGYLALDIVTTNKILRSSVESSAAQVYLLGFQAARTEAKVNQTAEEQRLYWKLISRQTSDSLRLLNLNLYGGVDVKTRQVYTGILPDLDRTVNTLNTSLAKAGDAAGDIGQVAKDSRQSLRAFNENLTALKGLLTDPAWHETLTNVDAMSKQGAEAMGHLNQTASNGQAITEDTKKVVHVYAERALKPATFLENVGGLILSKGAEVSQWVYGFFKK